MRDERGERARSALKVFCWTGGGRRVMQGPSMAESSVLVAVALSLVYGSWFQESKILQQVGGGRRVRERTEGEGAAGLRVPAAELDVIGQLCGRGLAGVMEDLFQVWDHLSREKADVLDNDWRGGFLELKPVAVDAAAALQQNGLAEGQGQGIGQDVEDPLHLCVRAPLGLRSAPGKTGAGPAHALNSEVRA